MAHGRMVSVFAALSLYSLANPTFAQRGHKALHDFRRYHSSECRPTRPSVRQVAATAQRMSELQQINLMGNRSVEEQTKEPVADFPVRRLSSHYRQALRTRLRWRLDQC